MIRMGCSLRMHPDVCEIPGLLAASVEEILLDRSSEDRGAELGTLTPRTSRECRRIGRRGVFEEKTRVETRSDRTGREKVIAITNLLTKDPEVFGRRGITPRGQEKTRRALMRMDLTTRVELIDNIS